MSLRIQWRMLQPRCKAQQDQAALILLLGETGSCDMALQVGNYRRGWQMLPDGWLTPGQHGQHTKH
eukprot:6825904-Ditylum_brightwellii.AAC.2